MKPADTAAPERLAPSRGATAQGDGAGIAALRSRCYARFAAAFAHPDGERLDAIRSGATLAGLRQLVAAVDPALDEPCVAPLAADVDAATAEDVQAEFTRLFEAGAQGPACPLRESHHRSGEVEIMESALRFYEFFALAPDGDCGQEPDQLRAELEFMHFLSYHEARLCRDGGSPEGLRRAQRDFLARHLAAWIPAWHDALLRSTPMPFFRSLAGLLASFIAAETRLHWASQCPEPPQARGATAPVRTRENGTWPTCRDSTPRLSNRD